MKTEPPSGGDQGRGRLGRTAAFVALLAVVAGSSAWLLTPGGPERTPGEEALGTPAVGTFKAPRELEIPDVEATERLRAEAVAGERPVWNYDESAIEDAASRVRAAFRAMREDLRRDRRGAVHPAERGRLEARLGAPVRPQDFDALARDRFSAEAEAQVIALAARALAGLVVEDASRLAGLDRGIVVRTLRAGSAQGEHAVFDLAIVRDVAAAREDVARAGEALPDRFGGALRGAITQLATMLVRPTLVFDAVETSHRRGAAAERVKPVLLRLKRGEKIVGDGERIERRHLVLFRGIEAQTRRDDVLAVRAGGAALLAAVLALLWHYARRSMRSFAPDLRDALLLAAAFVGTLAMSAAGFALGDLLHDRLPRLPPEAFHLLVPFAAGAMIVRSVLSGHVALLFSMASAIAVGLLAGRSLFFAIHVLLTGCAVAGLGVRQQDRASLFRLGAIVGLLGAGLSVATHLFTGGGLVGALWPALAALFAGTLLLPILAVGMLPVVELVFGYVTDVKLLELANLNHPALKDLIVQAPGTYHHSVVMASLVEAAAEAVGANPLLARVCAYYHDIGKTKNPSWFAENQRGENRHDQAAPSMSAVIVRRHVSDGLELARHWKLPPAVAEIIGQHHGTRLVSFFHAKAQEAALAAGDDAPLEEALYRYPGPRPQTVEAALVMIADVCEASARALPDPSRENLKAIVERRVHELFVEGQLDECPLTLRDLTTLGVAMSRALEAVYHVRPDYPERTAPPAGGPALQVVGKS